MSSPQKTTASQQVNPSSFALFKRCIHYFKPYKLRIVIAVIAMLIAGVCNAGAAWLVKPALDDIFLNKDERALVVIPLLFILITFGKVSTRLIQNYLMQYCGLRVLETLREELFSKIIMLPVRFYENTQVGMLMSRIINDVIAIRTSLPALVMLIRQVITMASLIGVAFYQNTRLAFWAIIVLPLAFYPFIYFGRRLRKLGRKNQEKLADISTLLQEILSGIRVVKAFGTEEKEASRFDKDNRKLLSIILKQCLAGEFSSAIMEMVGAIGIGIVLWFGGMQVITGQSDPGTFFSFVTALVMLYDPVKKMSNSNNEIQRALAGAERVFAILDDPALEVEQSGAKEVSGPFRELAFNNVSFAYKDGTMALNNINFTLRQGERVAIVGPSGAGKTTFVNLIPRFYEARTGEILLNGEKLENYDLASLRRSIAIVSQDNFLFNLSVAENITYGMGDVSEEVIHNAAMAAFAHDFITTMPEGYDTVVGERGVMLSGGQKQRLTIARAIVKDAPLLILDEATSALDSQAERIVQMALENLMQNRTSIVIAHRLSTVIGADRILVMENGTIAAQGTHEELLERSPLYSRLYAMQFKLEEVKELSVEIGEAVQGDPFAEPLVEKEA